MPRATLSNLALSMASAEGSSSSKSKKSFGFASTENPEQGAGSGGRPHSVRGGGAREPLTSEPSRAGVSAPEQDPPVQHPHVNIRGAGGKHGISGNYADCDQPSRVNPRLAQSHSRTVAQSHSRTVGRACPLPA